MTDDNQQEDRDQYKKILESLYDGVYYVDRERRINFWNEGAERITGYPAGKVVGRFCQDNLLQHVTENGKELCLHGCPLLATIQDGKTRESEIYLRHADGHRVPVIVRTSPLRNEQGEIIGGVEVFSDNSSLSSMRQKMRRLEDTVSIDPTTGIGNRRYMERKIMLALIDFHQNQVPFGILFADIDGFKAINDTHGHAIGDRTLRMVAYTFRDNLRSEDAAARWGGDEFVILVGGTYGNKLAAIAEKLRLLIQHSGFQTKIDFVKTTVSIGGTMARSGDTLTSLIRRADENMYLSKTAGRNRVTFDGAEPTAE